jgi:hypothetical protein
MSVYSTTFVNMLRLSASFSLQCKISKGTVTGILYSVNASRQRNSFGNQKSSPYIRLILLKHKLREAESIFLKISSLSWKLNSIIYTHIFLGVFR